MKIENIIKKLNSVNGLHDVIILNNEYKDIIFNLEEDFNYGVKECLNRDITLVLTHDSNFREPTSKIVERRRKKIIFPPIGFPEIKARNVVSSSPSIEVHKFLVDKFNLKNSNESATLLIGFDL